MGSHEPPNSRQYDECRYLARSLAVSLQDLDAESRSDILSYLSEELQRLSSQVPEENGDLDMADLSDRAMQGSDVAGRSAGA